MIKTIKTAGVTILCALLLLSSASCFKLVTGGDVDKEWPRNNAKNPHHSPARADSTYINDTIR